MVRVRLRVRVWVKVSVRVRVGLRVRVGVEVRFIHQYTLSMGVVTNSPNRRIYIVQTSQDPYDNGSPTKDKDEKEENR